MEMTITTRTNYLMAGLLATTIASAAMRGYENDLERSPNTLPVVTTWPAHGIESITIYDPKDRMLSYVDMMPFRSLDYVIDYTSGKRVERHPQPNEVKRFEELWAVAEKNNMLPWIAMKEKSKNKPSRTRTFRPP
jgi:hypothetical protein